MPKWCAAFEKRLKTNAEKGHVGKLCCNLSVADMYLYATLADFFFNDADWLSAELKVIVKNYPTLMKFWEINTETFKAYMAARPKPRPF